MSTSSEALRVVKEMSSKSLTVYGFRVYAHISDRYKRLTNGSVPKPSPPLLLTLQISVVVNPESLSSQVVSSAERRQGEGQQQQEEED